MILDAIFTNGHFTTLEPNRPTANSVGVFAGQIAGFDEELDHLPAKRRVDLGGAWVYPGFHDAHHHLSGRGRALMACDLSRAAAPTMAELYAAVERYAATLACDEWIFAAGYSDSYLGGHPQREGLDAVCGGRPAFIQHASGHGGVLNSEGVRRVSGDPDYLPDVEFGFVERRPDGTLTGFIAERSVESVSALLRPSPVETLVRAIELASRAALADGLTSVTEPGVSGKLTGNGPGDLAAYQLALDRGLLGVRATVMPEFAALHAIAGHEPDMPGFGLDLGISSGLGDDRLRLGPVKIFSDGALTSHTAALNCPYEHGTSTGVLHQDVQTLAKQIDAAHRAGWQIATHAIGDRAVEAVVGAYEAAQAAFPRQDSRHRIEHCGMADDAVIARMVKLGLVPVPQGEFLTLFGDAYLAAIGPARAAIAYRQQSFLQAGLEIPGSSDCPVVPGSPIAGIHALVNRVTPTGEVFGPKERLTVAQAIRAYTYGSAYAEHAEQRKGRAIPGLAADFTVLSDDLFQVAPESISAVAVVGTIVGGRVLFGESSFAVG